MARPTSLQCLLRAIGNHWCALEWGAEIRVEIKRWVRWHYLCKEWGALTRMVQQRRKKSGFEKYLARRNVCWIIRNVRSQRVPYRQFTQFCLMIGFSVALDVRDKETEFEGWFSFSGLSYLVDTGAIEVEKFAGPRVVGMEVSSYHAFNPSPIV